jgi:holin-like protein
MILQLAIIFAFLGFGELVVYLTGIPIPSSIIGMLALTTALKFKLIRVLWVDKAADALLSNMGFFFVPAAVGVMNCFGIISDQWLPIIAASVISTFIVIAVTGWTHQLARRIK